MRFPGQWPAPSALFPGTRLSQWALMIREAMFKNQWQEALSLYREMKDSGIVHGPSMLPPILRACGSLLSLKHGTSVHAFAIKNGFELIIPVANSTLAFYTKCRKMGYALNVFNCLQNKDSVSWNVMICGRLNQGAAEEGLDLFKRARLAGFEPIISTLVLVIQACWNLRATQEGLKMHGLIIRSGFLEIISVQNSLLSMHVKFHSLESACQLFGEMPVRDVISWSTMIAGYAQNGQAHAALWTFREMQFMDDIYPDDLTMVSVLQACTRVADIERGQSVHAYVIQAGMEYDLFVENSLIELYSKCSDIDAALKVFDKMSQRNNVSWNSIISGLVHNKQYVEALVLFGSMDKAGIRADEITVVNILQSSKNLGDADRCKCIHSMIVRKGFETNNLVASSLMDAYAKCGSVELAERLFRQMKQKDLVSWSSMIAGFAHCGKPNEAVALFKEMQVLLEEKLNWVTMLSLLEACTISADLKSARWTHGIVTRRGFGMEVEIGTALVDLYAKCGDIEAARKMFDEMPETNIVSWSAMIAAYSMNSHAHEALTLFREMELKEEIKPNKVTVLSVLAACSHGGLVDEGQLCFEEMVRDHGLVPCSEHYACMVDMFGRAGDLGGALDVIRKMPKEVEAGPRIWGALLSACRNHGDTELGGVVADRVLELEPSNAAGYVLASSMYAAAGFWGDVARMRCLVRKRGLRVVAGCSLIEANHRIYRFVAGDRSHPQSSQIYATIEHLLSSMKREGDTIS